MMFPAMAPKGNTLPLSTVSALAVALLFGRFLISREPPPMSLDEVEDTGLDREYGHDQEQEQHLDHEATDAKLLFEVPNVDAGSSLERQQDNYKVADTILVPCTHQHHHHGPHHNHHHGNGHRHHNVPRHRRQQDAIPWSTRRVLVFSQASIEELQDLAQGIRRAPDRPTIKAAAIIALLVAGVLAAVSAAYVDMEEAILEEADHNEKQMLAQAVKAQQ